MVMVMNPIKPITIYETAELAASTFPKAFSPSNIQKDFEVAELYPLNENVFEEHEFLTAYVTIRSLNDTTGTHPEEQQQTDNNVTENTDSAGSSCSYTISQEVFLSSRTPITPEMLRPYPKAPYRKKKGGRPRGKSKRKFNKTLM
ncbi:hypothetical protein ILUMI_09024 [Ignelater luminosus]|uniref:Uncharacterized protein n=1 Tax=Ignelater luminosus TaxID=2038154 RepID=A0A8K0D0K6_IGNLU|nr:hypothetical protein ILUMI_09024 [Ignelater luminosus]